VFAISFFMLGSIAVGADKVYNLRLSTHFVQTDPCGMGVKKFIELVDAKSGGRIKTKVWWASELGKERENGEMVHDGSIEMTTSLPVGAGGYVPETAIVEFPYIYKDDNHMYRVMTAVRPYLEEILTPYNFKPIGVIDVGFRMVLSKKKPIYKLPDLKGLKIRVPNPFYDALFDHLGATGTVITWSDVYVALQSGVADAMEASPALIDAMKFYEQAKYLSKTYHIAAVIVYLTNKNWFDSLPADLQEIVIEAADEASKYQFDLQIKSEDVSIEKLKKAGIKVNDVDDINEFRNAAIAFREQYVKDKGPKWEKLYNKMMAVE
jgi:tripartite ATP-independent transporter DctP family solute receptor